MNSKIEWKTPVPGTFGHDQFGYVEGEHRFTIKDINAYHAQLMDESNRGKTVAVCGGIDDGYGTHIEHLQDIAISIIEDGGRFR